MANEYSLVRPFPSFQSRVESRLEVLGGSSTGRTAFAHSLLATATKGGEIKALVDCDDAFDQAADLILHNCGFGLILLDLCDAPPAALQRVPTSYWYRFQRAVENTPTIFLILARQSVARSSSARQLSLQQQRLRWRGQPPFQTIERLELEAISRKPVHLSPVRMEALV